MKGWAGGPDLACASEKSLSSDDGVDDVEPIGKMSVEDGTESRDRRSEEKRGSIGICDDIH